MDDKQGGLYIPINIRKRKEYIDGFGQRELNQTLVGILIGTIISLIVFFFFCRNVIVIVGIISVVGGSTAMMVKKDNYNRSTIDSFKAMIEFSKNQKRYYYKYTNIYEAEVSKKNVKKIESAK